MTQTELTILIRKYLSGEATEQEKSQVEKWYESFDKSALKFADGNMNVMDESTFRSLLAIREKIAKLPSEELQKTAFSKVAKRNFRWRWAAAAAVLILLAGGFYTLFFKAGEVQPKIATTLIKKDFKPGGNNAILTLANGKQIILDSANTGTLSLQGNTKVIKLNNGLLAYNANQRSQITDQRSQIEYNTIATPRGGQYEVVLPDGTKVWLNAASSIRFPTAFIGKEREVSMTGEAYFEVAKNVKQPFKVTVKGMTVHVLGTHFNVMAYNDEATIKTTLLEGAVKVTEGNNALLLRPGEAAQVDRSGEMRTDENVNTNEVIAWKNNLFWFDNDNVQEIVKQLSRWYNVDIVVDGNIPDLFTGSIPRNIPFSKVFEVLQKTGSIHYQIENNKTIIVTP
ncbi:MAG: FecR family protein [Chitinophagaceae bacterium]|nr:MAG: FecR family protein [Chitinophagaceae bacterium]